ncbi:MAG: PepSY domain-containing protein [Vicinamibacterales bacterium]|nr:PepSY domain-containing protein [Vicinamibacterales bacterium]
MHFNVLNRKVHYWSSAIVAIPLLVIITSGLLLQAKKHWTWVQPAEHRGTGTTPVLDLEAILASVRSVPDLQVGGWDDVDRLDVRPGRGVVKVLLRSGWEVQVDLGTGEVLQSAYRRSDLIESIHDGSIFGGDWTKLGVFLPAGATLLLLWFGGLWMWWVPFIAKRRRSARRAAAHDDHPRPL